MFARWGWWGSGSKRRSRDRISAECRSFHILIDSQSSPANRRPYRLALRDCFCEIQQSCIIVFFWLGEELIVRWSFRYSGWTLPYTILRVLLIGYWYKHPFVSTSRSIPSDVELGKKLWYYYNLSFTILFVDNSVLTRVLVVAQTTGCSRSWFRLLKTTQLHQWDHWAHWLPRHRSERHQRVIWSAIFKP